MGYCRSKFQFCGVGPEYCNVNSQWRVECGTPNPTHQPSTGPTTGEPTESPTTGQPTFIHDPDIHCVGEPCNEEEEDDGTLAFLCRSEIGYCGSGALYCNLYSSWTPECDSVPTASPSGPSLLAITGSPSLENIPAPAVVPSKDNAMFSPLALPTLSHIINPKQFDIGSVTRGHINSTAQEESSVQTDASLSAITELSTNEASNGEEILSNNKPIEVNNGAEETQWYVRFADVNPVDRNIGFRLDLGSVVLFSAMIHCLL